VTNLRILWISHKNTKTNLSIGFNTTLNINIRKAKSRLRGNTQALYIMTKFGPSRYASTQPRERNQRTEHITRTEQHTTKRRR
jgi:hypothetical protein